MTQKTNQQPSELEVIFQFTQNLTEKESPDALVAGLLQALQTLGVNAILKTYASNFHLVRSHHPDLDQSKLIESIEETRKGGRIVELKARVYFNWKYLSLLIEKLPGDSTQHFASLKDIIVILLNIGNQLLGVVARQGAAVNQEKSVSRCLIHLSELTGNNIRRMNTGLCSNIEDLVYSIHETLENIPIPEDKKKQLLNQAGAQLVKTEKLAEQAALLEKQLKLLNEGLEDLFKTREIEVISDKDQREPRDKIEKLEPLVQQDQQDESNKPSRQSNDTPGTGGANNMSRLVKENYSILIVDDEKDSLTLLEYVLQDEGYHIITASSAKECLQLLNEHSVDMVITDINMPEMSGFELCEIIKDDYKDSEIPVLFLSALDQRQQHLGAGELGADEYLTKPIDSDDLVKRVATIFQFQGQDT